MEFFQRLRRYMLGYAAHSPECLAAILNTRHIDILVDIHRSCSVRTVAGNASAGRSAMARVVYYRKTRSISTKNCVGYLLLRGHEVMHGANKVQLRGHQPSSSPGENPLY